MPLLFTTICDLLSDLESIRKRQPPLLAATVRQETNAQTNRWCQNLNLSINSIDLDAVALLSTLFPKRRTDRVYGIQPRSLSRKLKRILGLGDGRHQLLDKWQEAGRGDLGCCVERALQQAQFSLQPRDRQVTNEEIDDVLASIAGGYRYSAPKVRAAANGGSEVDVDEQLRSLYRRTQSREAKWLTRLILKDYGAVEIPEWVVFRCIDLRLPLALKIHDTFEDAVRVLRCGEFSGHGDRLMPQVGVKVGRTTYSKARSVKHAVSMIGNRSMSVERKYDGEYCQIHVDVTRRDQQIQIFSKSGKDSTADRSGLHDTLKQCLNLGNETCVFSSRCILEGEMIIWSDRDKIILPFHNIRKHVSRSGSFLGTSADSLPHHYEHLMILFYDVLQVDNDSCLQCTHTSRRRLLERIVSQLPGRAELAAQLIIDFASPQAPEQLRNHYANAITNRWEGLVLKPLDEPYFGRAKRSLGDPPSCWLKLKKDYITGLGDTADFAVVGAGYCVKAAARCPLTDLRWTHFHIGCLKNKDAVIQLGAKPQYVILDAIHQSLGTKDLQYLNQHGQFRCVKIDSADCVGAFNLEYASWEGPSMTVAFQKPFVFEIMGGGFVKLANSEYYALRWPRVLKIHQDRHWKESVSLDELQSLAHRAINVPDAEDFQGESAAWQKKLDVADRGARKVMLPWDESQDEQSGLDPPASVSGRNKKRSKQANAPPLIRMDTSEMTPDELRLSTGEVTGRPMSSGSIVSCVSESSLPTPPTSSPNNRHRGMSPTFETQYLLITSPSNGKRPLEDPEDRRVLPKKPKHVRRGEIAQPMHESSSSANRVGRPSSSITSTKANGHPDTFLVRKVPPGVNGLPIKSRFKRPRHIARSASPDRQTTVFERTSQTTSHTSQRTGRDPSLIPRISDSTMNLGFPKDLAPSPPVIVPHSLSSPPIPDLLSCPVMLSPCISRTPYLLENLLPGRVSNIVPLPQHCSQAPLLTPPPTNPSVTPLAILLIESKRQQQSSQLMISMLSFLQQSCHGRIEIWDWTLLELISKGETNVRRLCKRFFGAMWWDGQANEAIMQWQDGMLMRLRIEKGKEACLVQKLRADGCTQHCIVEKFGTKNATRPKHVDNDNGYSKQTLSRYAE